MSGFLQFVFGGQESFDIAVEVLITVAAVLFNLMFDDERSHSRNLYFVLKNKQTGLTWEDEELGTSDVGFAYQYMSFPYTQYLDPEFKGEVTFHLEWEWFDPSTYTGELPYRTVSAKQGNYIVNIQ